MCIRDRDGTILHLAKLVALNKIPVLGINMGGLGFIAELEAGELEALRKLKDWDFQTEQRMMLDVTDVYKRQGEEIRLRRTSLPRLLGSLGRDRTGPVLSLIHI